MSSASGNLSPDRHLTATGQVPCRIAHSSTKKEVALDVSPHWSDH
jgi:hypothetical protein